MHFTEPHLPTNLFKIINQDSNMILYFCEIEDVYDLISDRIFEFLNQSEQLKLNSFKSCYKKKAFIVGRFLVKNYLQKNLLLQDEGLCIMYNSHGKPYVKGSNYHFNISYSNKKICVAFSINTIGVDIEYINPSRKWENLLDLLISAECEINNSLEFYISWTQIEAYLKMKGIGFASYEKIGKCQFHEIKSLTSTIVLEEYVISFSVGGH